MDGLALICTYSALIGVVTHICYFKQGDHLHETPLLLKLFFAAPVLLFSIVKTLAFDLTLTESATCALAIFGSFITALWSSMVVYRLLFHPLRRFPGPFWFKVSKLFQPLSLRGKNNFHQQLDKFYAQYGDFVRIGPNEVAVFAGSEAFQAISSSGSKCYKGDWYSKVSSGDSVVNTTDLAMHAKRRKLWDQGFSTKALQTYEQSINKFSKTLATRFNERAGQSVNVTHWFHSLAFDFMGDFAFGQSFAMLETGETHFAVKAIHDNMRDQGDIGRVPWAYIALLTAPWAMSGTKRLREWAVGRMQHRLELENKSDRADVMSAIIKEYHKADNKQRAISWAIGDARVAILAGSDTTASTFCFLFYYLTQYPEHIATLRQELDPLQNPDTGTFTNLDLQNKAPHLNAVINETLRLNPSVPSGVYRITPPEGLNISGTYIPGNTNVLAPIGAIQRLPSCFEEPNSFVPERWTTKPEMLIDKEAFGPFNIGKWSCAGKQVALMELRIATATIVSSFDFKFAPGEDGSSLLNDSEDCFTLQPKPLNLVFSARDGKENGHV